MKGPSIGLGSFEVVQNRAQEHRRWWQLDSSSHLVLPLSRVTLCKLHALSVVKVLL